MNRRGFLGALLAAPAVPIAARLNIPEIAPALPVRSGNLLLTPAMITKEAARILKQNMDYLEIVRSKNG